jgi:hypothetical protein
MEHNMKTMKMAAAAFILTMGMTTGVSTAAGNAATDVGLGFILGNPTGLSLKLPSGRTNAFQFILAYDNSGRDGWNNNGWRDDDCYDGPGDGPCDGRLYLGGDYVWYNYNAIPVNQGRLPFYYGPGLWTAVSDNAAIGIRFVLGLEYQFATAPFDIFLEVAPGIRVVPNTDGFVAAGLGARFFF